MRKAVQITGAAIIAAVLMTGCGSESKDGGDKPAQATPPADAPKAPSQEPAAGGGDVTATKLAGGWSKGKLADKSIMILSFSDKTVMLSTAGKACAGMVNESAKPVALTFNCKDGGTQYASATVKSVDANSLTVVWASGTEDTLKKAVGMDGKPAAGLPGKIG